MQGLGMEWTTASNAAFVTGLSVVFVYLIEVATGSEKPSPRLIAAVALSVAGLYLLAFRDAAVLNLGDAVVLAGAVFWALQIIAVTRYSGLSLLHLLLLECAFTAVGAVFLLPLVSPPSTDALASVVPQLLYLSTLCTLLANALQLYGQRRVSSTQAAIIYLLEPVFAALFSHVLLGEYLAPKQAVGAAMIVAAMAASTVKGQRGHRH